MKINWPEVYTKVSTWFGLLLIAAPEIYTELPTYEQQIPKWLFPHLMAIGGLLVVVAKIYEHVCPKPVMMISNVSPVNSGGGKPL